MTLKILSMAALIGALSVYQASAQGFPAPIDPASTEHESGAGEGFGTAGYPGYLKERRDSSGSSNPKFNSVPQYEIERKP
jgi:hypothetical protein